MKAFTKTILRTFLNNKGRFLSNALTVLISLAFSGGLAVIPKMYEESYINTNYKDKNVPDIILKNKTNNGFSSLDIEKIKEDSDVEDILPLMSMDYISDDSIYRINIQDLTSKVSKLTLLEGNYPTSTYDFSSNIPIIAIKGSNNLNYYKIGDTISLKLDYLSSSFGLEEKDLEEILGKSSFTLEVVGIVESPLFCSSQRENAYLENEDDKYIDSVFFLERDLLPSKVNIGGFSFPTSSFVKNTDLEIVYNLKEKEYFSSKYEKEIKKKENNLIETFGEENVSSLTLEENVSYALFKNYNDKVSKLTYIVPIFFITVCALVNLITISRLIKEERSVIATYLSLGVSKNKIIFKYVSFSLLSAFIGGIIGLIVGIPLLPNVILPAYQSCFNLKGIHLVGFNLLAYLLFLGVLLVSFLVTLYCSLKTFRETPASLMKMVSPKPGKKILLERISFIWKRLSFRFKSSFRNIFRQKKNLILTSLSVIGSTILLMLGFGLLDISNALVDDPLFGGVASSMGLISFVIVLFAISMTIVVNYSLANMNIADRQREIATLKVLGYHDRECSMYTFREIMIISIGASLLALPLSALIMYYVFDWLDFGSVSDVKWYSYVISFLLMNITVVFINLLLYPRIKEVDMNESLKTLD